MPSFYDIAQPLRDPGYLPPQHPARDMGLVSRLARQMGLDDPSALTKTQRHMNMDPHRVAETDAFLSRFGGEDGLVNTVEEAKEAYLQTHADAVERTIAMTKKWTEDRDAGLEPGMPVYSKMVSYPHPPMPFGTVEQTNIPETHSDDPEVQRRVSEMLHEELFNKGYGYGVVTHHNRPDLFGEDHHIAEANPNEGAIDYYGREPEFDYDEYRTALVHELGHLLTLAPLPESIPGMEAPVSDRELDVLTGGHWTDERPFRREMLHNAVYDYDDRDHWKSYLGRTDLAPSFKERLRIFEDMDSGEMGRRYNEPDGARVRNLLRMVDSILHDTYSGTMRRPAP